MVKDLPKIPKISIQSIPGLPEIQAGNSLGKLIGEAVYKLKFAVQEKDVFVLTHKIVAKAEGRVIQLDKVRPSPLARSWAQELGKDPSLIEIILSETRRVVRMDKGRLITETHQGLVCANAGVDVSNSAPGMATLLPKNADLSAQKVRDHLKEVFGCNLAVIISDSFGRPWREGLVNLAIGVAGLMPLMDYRGEKDSVGRVLQATAMGWADEIASAAELVMGKTMRLPVAVVRGLNYEEGIARCSSFFRSSGQDLFR